MGWVGSRDDKNKGAVDESIGLSRKAAEKGQPKAQMAMAVRCYNGIGDTKDYDEAVKWAQKAADKGEGMAMGKQLARIIAAAAPKVFLASFQPVGDGWFSLILEPSRQLCMRPDVNLCCNQSDHFTLAQENPLQLPKRFETHVTESTSFRLFSNAIPDDWILREVTERDYGIDCYVEICRDGFVTGQLLSVQLKGSECITLREDEKFATYYGLEPSTINYWNNLPMPVILAYIDTNSKTIYISDIKKYIRENYAEFLNETLTTIKIPEKSKLTKGISNQVLTTIYRLETNRTSFEHFIGDFLLSVAKNVELLSGNHNLDAFLPIDEDDEFRMINFYRNCELLAIFYNVPWDIKPLSDMVEEGQKLFGPHYLLYALQVTHFVESVSPIFKNVITNLIGFIQGKESAYWINRNPSLLRYIKSHELKNAIADLEEIIAIQEKKQGMP